MRSLSLQMERLFCAAKFQDDSDGFFFFTFSKMFHRFHLPGGREKGKCRQDEILCLLGNEFCLVSLS